MRRRQIVAERTRQEEAARQAMFAVAADLAAVPPVPVSDYVLTLPAVPAEPRLVTWAAAPSPRDAVYAALGRHIESQVLDSLTPAKPGFCPNCRTHIGRGIGGHMRRCKG